MTTGIVLSCPPEAAAACLEPLNGRAPLGHALDRIARALPGLPVVLALPEGGAALRRWARHSGLPVTAERDPALAARAQGWSAALVVGAGQALVDTAALIAARALIETGHYGRVTAPDHPAGTGLLGLRLNHPDGAEHALPGPAPTPGLTLDAATPEGRAAAQQVLTRAGADPAALPLARVIALATEPASETPWKGAAGPLTIAEIGGNHEGDFEVAKSMAASAIRSGADCVKFQLYTGASLVSPVESPARHAHFKTFELAKEQHIYLAEMCREAGTAYVSSVWDEEMLGWIDPYMGFYKVGSGDLTAWPLLAKLAERGKPILLSTGLATLDEAVQTVAQIQAVDDRYTRPEWLCIMQCTAMYPIPDHDANLRVMDALRAATGLAVGYSDHTIGGAALRAATAMGAEALEFHFTDAASRAGKAFRDHKVSLVEEEVAALMTDLAQITALRGRPVKVPQPSELDEAHEVSFRRAAYLNRDGRAGEVIAAEDLAILRPAHGTDARDAATLIGKPLLTDVPAFAALNPGTDYPAES